MREVIHHRSRLNALSTIATLCESTGYIALTYNHIEVFWFAAPCSHIATIHLAVFLTRNKHCAQLKSCVVGSGLQFAKIQRLCYIEIKMDTLGQFRSNTCIKTFYM